VAFSHDSTRLASASYDKMVKIWEICSGICLQTLSTRDAFSDISCNNFVRTEIATPDVSTLNVDPSPALAAVSAITELQTPQYKGLAVSPDNKWITYDLVESLWLPSDYRPLCSAVSGMIIAIGVGSGRYGCVIISIGIAKSLYLCIHV